jgi:hypothetical protein
MPLGGAAAVAGQEIAAPAVDLEAGAEDFATADAAAGGDEELGRERR